MSLTSAFSLVRCSRFVVKPALLVYVADRDFIFKKLVSENASLNKAFLALKSDNEILKSDNEILRSEIKALQDKVLEFENHLGLSSRNSSIPPSNDTIANREKIIKSRKERRDEARKKAGANKLNRGKQPGAKGNNLAFKDVADEVVIHQPDRCESCDIDLAGIEPESMERRQVFDIPDPVVKCTEHVLVKKRCPCGCLNSSKFPEEAIGTTCYGPNIRAIGLYLLTAQHIPVERTKEALCEMFKIDVSTGFLSSLPKEASGNLDEFMDQVSKYLLVSKVIQADETSDQVGYDKTWFHVTSNELLCHLYASSTRGKAAPDEAGILPNYKGTIVHDRFSFYFSYVNADHALCSAHLLRDLDKVATSNPSQVWTKDMKDLLLAMNESAKSAREAGKDEIPKEQLVLYLKKYDEIVKEAHSANPELQAKSKVLKSQSDSYNLAAAFSKYKTEITLFAKDLDIPFTNNEAERSLRMIKLHKKIRGCFQSPDAPQYFARIRSYTATARKQKVGSLEVLARLFRGNCWMPFQPSQAP